VGIGIHAGEAVTGNVGSSLRKQYSITGNVVIVASRLEQQNKQFQSQLLIVGRSVKAIGSVEDAVHLGIVQVKGEEKPVSLYLLAQ
jgi:adenylate cyclase